ncbi:Cysteine-rich RLK (receptor-like protein kinase) 8 [Cucumis melo var. makuwa]|uniref:Cysteine-rich RLK (Receptor-like protein kinase) 8 n=1 Tax=Cucumis melo var. makuwa TaxID=1194695 RepID=A0A5A7T803_CUCMM|nr:Cysteine-rich RLK (receptor-like protein kinase) 8 [Cucumis melo var. makuwa]TYJ97049.1 Cysteine-rich RLK (receptor-like protein kinase) 8 [Cucumis melo var. makuwa]
MSPPRFEAQFDHQAYKPQRSLYGLKQSSKAWFDTFTPFVKSLEYSQGHSDHTLFTKVSKTGKIAVLIVYVDDIVLSRDDNTEIIQLKKKMVPYEEQMVAVNRILRYLKTTPGKRLMFRKTDRRAIEAYNDSDWAGFDVDKKSTYD